MKKLKNILVALCLCVCVGFGCFALTGCADSKTLQELEDLRTQVETLKNNNDSLEAENEENEKINSTLARDKALTKIYEAHMFTADDGNSNQTSEYPDELWFDDPAMPFYQFVELYRVADLQLNKVYVHERTDESGNNEFSFSIIVDENKIIYQYTYLNDPYYSNTQLTLTLDENDNITNIDYFRDEYHSIGTGEETRYYYYYYEASYTINSIGLNASSGVDMFSVKEITYVENDNSLVVDEFVQMGGTYDKFFADHYDYTSMYYITELRQFNKNIQVSGELTINETLSQEEANGELNNLKSLYDVSSYPVENIDMSSIIGN